MQVEECVKKLKSKGIIDSREIYIYASLKNIIGGMFGSIRGLVLLCIYEEYPRKSRIIWWKVFFQL